MAAAAASIGGVGKLSPRLGRVIRRRRLAAGLSQEALAERADVHRNEIGFLERGQRSPSLDVVARVAAALGLPASQLLVEAEAEADEAHCGASDGT